MHRTVFVAVCLAGAVLLVVPVAHAGWGKRGLGVPRDSVGSSQVRDGSLLAKDFKAGQLGRGQRGSVGPRGRPGSRGPRGAPGTSGPRGLRGLPGSNDDDGVAAYAFVVPGEVSLHVDPVLVTSQSRNVTRVTSPAIGVYCLRLSSGLSAARRAAVAAPELSRSRTASAAVFAYTDTSGRRCSFGSLEVHTLTLVAGNPVAQHSEQVAFTVIVP